MSALPGGWIETTLGEQCRVKYGKGLSGAQRTQTGIVPVLGSAGEVGRHSEALVDGPVIVVGRKGNAGAVHLVRSPCWPIDTTYFVRVPPCFDPAFLSFQLHGANLRSLDSSTAVPSLRRPDLEACRIMVPPLREQERIVVAIDEQFSRLDEAEHLLRSARRRAERLRTAAMAAAMSGDWPVKALADVTVRQEYGSSAKASVTPTNGVPIVRMGNVQDGRVDLARDVKYLPADHPDVARYGLQNGDLLFNRTNSPELVGKSAVFRGSPGSACFASYLIRVQLDEHCLPEWASLYLNSPGGRRWASSVRSQQVGQANINGSKLAAMPLPLPSVDEQHRILGEVERHVSLVESAIAVVDHALVRSGHLRRSILGRAFSGQLVPQDPSDEPASELLTWVQTELSNSDGPRRRKRS
jgi:type I restriction enzyme S subunit